MADDTLADLYGYTTAAREQERTTAKRAAMTRGSGEGLPGGFDPMTYEPPPTALRQPPAPEVSEEELQGNLAAANETLSRPPGAMDIYAGQAAGNEQAYGDAVSSFLANQPLRGSRANPRKPFVDRRAAERHEQSNEAARDAYIQAKPFKPVPFDPSRFPRFEDGDYVESDEEYAGRMETFAELDMQEQAERYQRQMEEELGAAKTLGDPRDIGRAPGALGMEEAKRQGFEGEAAAAENLATEQARAQAIAAQEQADATREMVDAQERQAAREQAAMRSRQKVTAVREQARKGLASMPEIDRDKIAKGLSGGNKLAAIFGAIAQGWSGQPITAVRDAINDGVAQEMDRYARRKSEYQDVVDEADEAMNYLDWTVTNLGGNVRAGESMLRAARIEDAIEQAKAREAAATVPAVKAQWANLGVQLEDDLRKETDMMDLQAITEPESFGFTIDSPAMRLAREEAKATMKQAREEGADIRKDFRGRTQALEIEGVKQEGAARAKNQKHLSEQAYKFGTDVEKIDTTLSGINKLLGEDDIKGYGFTASPLPETWTGEADTNAQIDLVLDELARLKSGAAIGEDEWEMYDQMLRGGTALGGEDRLRRNLVRVKEFLTNKRNSIERGMDPEARAHYNRNAAAADFEQRWTGGDAESVVEED